MKRLFSFTATKTRKLSVDLPDPRTSLLSWGSTNDASDNTTQANKAEDPNVNVTGAGLGYGGRQSPTILKRPTGRDGAGPWKSLQVLATEDALLVRPKPSGDFSDLTSTILKISWSKVVEVAEVKVGLGAAAAGIGNHTSEGGVNKKPLEDINWESALDIYGIVGIMTLFSASHLLVITDVNDLGNLCSESRQVYGVKDVAYIPLEYVRASDVITRIIARNRSRNVQPIPISVPPKERRKSEAGSLHIKWASQILPAITPDTGSIFGTSPPDSGLVTPSTIGVSVAPLAKALSERLSFWKGKSVGNEASIVASKTSGDHETLGELVDDIDSGETDNLLPAQAVEDIVAAAAPEPKTDEERYLAMEEKVLNEWVRQYTKGGMYFSYTFDLSSSVQRKQQAVERLRKQDAILSDLDALGDWSTLEPCQESQPFKEPFPKLPLWRRIDRRFWWNEHLLQPFIEAELHSYILPILQGHFQYSRFRLEVVPDSVYGPSRQDSVDQSDTQGVDTAKLDSQTGGVEVGYIVISRRSRERAGLRYQRRGIDDDAHVANFVETEAIVHLDREGVENVFSYVQIRGSIPLFWTQSGYGLKPPPLLDPNRTQEQHLKALTEHMDRSVKRYGPLTSVNLTEHQGKEGPITDAYRETMAEYNSTESQYHQWDFHAECRGMRYENISKLITELDRSFEKQGFYWTSGSTVMSQQRGVFRVNCIDCLDRTNVVQSAFARHVLHSQLEAVAILNETHTGHSEAENVINDVWANNGDAISRAYAGTSALKGDFTRTGRRDLGGLLNDGINSLARVYTSTFSDWFSQSVIDFALGYRGTSVFIEFMQNLSSSDPRELLRLSKIREAAIEQACSIVLYSEERFLSGWTLLSPTDLNVKLADKFEEKILLLTEKAIYIVSYDYTLEKVKMSTRVPLGDITGIEKGAYILSTLNNQTKDPVTNFGLSISFLVAHQDTRVTSYSVRNRYNPEDAENANLVTKGEDGRTATLSHVLSKAIPAGKEGFVAFKSLPVDGSMTDQKGTNNSSLGGTPKESVGSIVAAVVKACEDFGIVDESFVKEEDIVSLAEAQRSTTLFAKFEYNFKRLLWLGS